MHTSRLLFVGFAATLVGAVAGVAAGPESPGAPLVEGGPAGASAAPGGGSPPRAATGQAGGPAASPDATAAPTFEPCHAAPKGMACIPGGRAVIGSDEHGPEEKPRHTVEVSTFYIDRFEVTAGDYKRCERERACPPLPRPRSYKLFQYNDQPAVPITWEMAHQYCVWAGKRLPSEAEWEKVARGGEKGFTYPWGDDPATCERANYKDCEPRITRKVGTYPAGAYGVHEMAGNGYEWVKDWATDCYEGACKQPCGAACQGRDPKGPCDGAERCPGFTKRVLKGGSWFWPADQMRGSWRRGQYPKSGIHRLSFRCASSSHILTAADPAYLKQKRERPALPEAPPADQLATFHDVAEDTDIFQIPECERVGKATTECRDPMSYLTSNEALQYVFRPAIENLGGGYVGIGADQNYSFIASARSEWAWLFDYDPQVVRVHQIVRAVAMTASTRQEFVNAFLTKNRKKTAEAIRAAMVGQPEEEIEATVRLLNRAGTKLWGHYVREMKPKRWYKGFGWLQTEENYGYIRLLYQQGRIRPLKGNMLTDVAMPSIAAAARKLQVPVRVYYTSNAEEQWRTLPEAYRRNVAQLPFDDETIVLRTLFTQRYHKAASKWHYVVHGGRHLQAHIVLDGYANVWRFMEDRHRVGEFRPPAAEGAEPQKARPLDFLSHIGVPSVTEYEPAAASNG